MHCLKILELRLLNLLYFILIFFKIIFASVSLNLSKLQICNSKIQLLKFKILINNHQISKLFVLIQLVRLQNHAHEINLFNLYDKFPKHYKILRPRILKHQNRVQSLISLIFRIHQNDELIGSNRIVLNVCYTFKIQIPLVALKLPFYRPYFNASTFTKGCQISVTVFKNDFF